MKTLEDKFVIGGSMVLLGSVIIAGSLVWYGIHTGAGRIAPPPPQKAERPSDVPDPKTAYVQKMPDMLATVVSVGNDKLVVKQSVDGNPVTVTVDGNTAIYRDGAQKSEVAYQKEMDAFIKSISFGDPEDQYYAPSRYELQKISLSDIKADEGVYIKAKDGVTGSTIAASSIEVLAVPQQ
jgi:hypothetical protein